MAYQAYLIPQMILGSGTTTMPILKLGKLRPREGFFLFVSLFLMYLA